MGALSFHTGFSLGFSETFCFVLGMRGVVLFKVFSVVVSFWDKGLNGTWTINRRTAVPYIEHRI